MDTRSLSITPIGNGSSDTNLTTNSALLFYENPTGNVPALLQRISPNSNQAELSSQPQQVQWVDITSQKSQGLPDEFWNDGLNLFDSRTLYESDMNATFSTPFTVIANDSTLTVGNQNEVGAELGALFYSPPDASLASISYVFNSSAPGDFIGGTHCKFSYNERSFVS